MDNPFTLIARATPGRMVTAATDGSLRITWDETTLRIGAYDLAHLAALLDDWRFADEPGMLRRGYYRIEPACDGGVQLWLARSGLWLSRDDLAMLHELIELAELQLTALCTAVAAQHPFGPGFRRHAASQSAGRWIN
ncbi:MAG: hypothetical protein AB4911_23520 [Oscillochloridaceae bacterium umkhey_bin13]